MLPEQGTSVTYQYFHNSLPASTSLHLWIHLNLYFTSPSWFNIFLPSIFLISCPVPLLLLFRLPRSSFFNHSTHSFFVSLSGHLADTKETTLLRSLSLSPSLPHMSPPSSHLFLNTLSSSLIIRPSDSWSGFSDRGHPLITPLPLICECQLILDRCANYKNSWQPHTRLSVFHPPPSSLP